uniref:Uncharacterized protein n=1 Tax=Chrysotila carterae TaxID=13221 RepID=A0A7S4C3D7_CHRCT|mmetsp:Transcript_39275/g.82395  ORF Transcript_39275/g.82395 Transcript_39275/m.82395 type:complete len:199 (-) Transcript_39275:374-970(-)|eukprot:6210342-Pleurochrysis_carterae.AAC.2
MDKCKSQRKGAGSLSTHQASSSVVLREARTTLSAPSAQPRTRRLRNSKAAAASNSAQPAVIPRESVRFAQLNGNGRRKRRAEADLEDVELGVATVPDMAKADANGSGGTCSSESDINSTSETIGLTELHSSSVSSSDDGMGGASIWSSDMHVSEGNSPRFALISEPLDCVIDMEARQRMMETITASIRAHEGRRLSVD